MQRSLPGFRALGAELIAVSSSPVEEHARVAARHGLEFPLLSDPEGHAMRAFGVLHPDALPFLDSPVARPAIFLVDSDGTLRDRLLTDNWRVRARPETLLERLRALERREP